MRSIRYLDFDLLIERGDEPGQYEARVIGAPSGEYEPVDFTAPFSELELENFLLKIGRRRNIVRGLDTQDGATVKAFGSQLFDRVFTGDLRLALATSLSETDSDDLGLRVRLRLSECPELADLPWEYLYDKTTRRFLALSEWTPVVRYLDLPGRVRRVSVEGPLRILGMASNPTDYPRLSVDDEWSKLRTALSSLEESGRVELRVVPDGTLASLHRELRRGDFHVFHYIGHGGFLPGGADGVLILEDANQRGLEVSGQDLGVSLHDHRTLRLAVLNSCEGARSGLSDPYSGTAQTLVQQGIPAVVAMQFEITDEAAITFSQVLYEAIADGYPLDASMAEARKAVRNQPNATEWGTPVLYLRSPDGHIFDMTQQRVAVPSQDAELEQAPPAGEASAQPPTAPATPDEPVAVPVDGPVVSATEEPVAPTEEPAAARTESAEPVTPRLPEVDAPPEGAEQPLTSRQPGRETPPTPVVSSWSAGGGGEPPTRAAPRRTDELVPDGGAGGGGGGSRHRGRWVAAAAGAAAVVVAVAIALGSGGNDDGGQTSTSGAADLDTVLAAASPLFSSDECAEATADNAPLAFSHGITPAIKCASSSVPFTGTYWCTDSSDSLLAARAVFLATAADTRVDITETPAGSDTVADGVQQSYHRIGSGAARVYWDSPAALCGAELQSTSPDTAPLIEFWHSG